MEAVDSLAVEEIRGQGIEENHAGEKDKGGVVVLEDSLEVAAEIGVVTYDLLVSRDASERGDGQFAELLDPRVALLTEQRGALQHHDQHGAELGGRHLVSDLTSIIACHLKLL